MTGLVDVDEALSTLIFDVARRSLVALQRGHWARFEPGRRRYAFAFDGMGCNLTMHKVGRSASWLGVSDLYSGTTYTNGRG